MPPSALLAEAWLRGVAANPALTAE